MRVMVTGARGLLGSAVLREFAPGCDVLPFDRAALDVTDNPAVLSAVADVVPDVVINCAAFNDVDGAEEQGDRAIAVNALAVLNLSSAASSCGCRFIHYSTDFVFDGVADRPYTEDDPPNPRSSYGMSKLLGDWFALENPRAYVLRVESLFGEPAPGLPSRGSISRIVDGIRAGEDVSVFTDRTVSPTYTADAAAATRALLERDAPPGLYHCVNSGAATWESVARETARILDRPIRLKPLTLEAARLKAPRPRYCALSNAKLAGIGIAMPDWRDALSRYLRAYRAESFMEISQENRRKGG